MKKGFTLVELSIVLVIIGLLIGGILVGQSLIESAQINRVVREAQQYQIMFTQFKEKFRAYPGDANSLFGGGGDDNGQITGQVEVFQAPKHLSDAGFLDQSYPGTGFTSNNFVPGTNVIESTYGEGNGWYFGFGVSATYYGLGDAHLLILSGSENNRSVTPALTPAFAAAVDNKTDDGLVDSGDTLGANARNGSGSWLTGCTDIDQNVTTPLAQGAIYDLSSSEVKCFSAFKINY